MENGIFMFGFCLNMKGRKERGEKRKRRQERQSFYIKFSEEFGQAVILPTVKVDKFSLKVTRRSFV